MTLLHEVAGLAKISNFISERRAADPAFFAGIDQRATTFAVGYHGRAEIRAANCRRLLQMEPTAANRHRWGWPDCGAPDCLSCRCRRNSSIPAETTRHRTARCLDAQGNMAAARLSWQRRITAATPASHQRPE